MPEPTHQTESAPSMAALVQGIVNDAQTLIRQELTLARTEIQKDWKDLKQAGAALGLVLPVWASFLIVGGVLALVGGVLLFRGVHKLNTVELGPEKTIETIK